MTRILVVDDHEIARRGIEVALRAVHPEAAFGEAGTTEEAMARLSGERWDLAVLDLNLPGRGGLELLDEIRRLHPRLPIVVVSAYAEQEFAIRCLRAGANGFVPKSAGAKELQAAVRKALEGGRYVTAALAERLAAALGGDVAPPSHEILSVRELQVLRLVALGRSAKEIGAELHLSERTIATYRGRIGAKLGLATTADIARYAVKHGLIE